MFPLLSYCDLFKKLSNLYSKFLREVVIDNGMKSSECLCYIFLNREAWDYLNYLCEEGFHYLLEEGVLIELLKFFQITLLPFYLMLLASRRRSWFQVSKNFTSKWYNSRGCYLYSSQDKTYLLELCSKVAPIRAILTPNLALPLSWETFALRDLNPRKGVHTGHLSLWS